MGGAYAGPLPGNRGVPVRGFLNAPRDLGRGQSACTCLCDAAPAEPQRLDVGTTNAVGAPSEIQLERDV